MMKWFGMMFMAALLVCAPGYGSAQQAKDTSSGTAKSFTPEERKAYEKKIAAELDSYPAKNWRLENSSEYRTVAT